MQLREVDGEGEAWSYKGCQLIELCKQKSTAGAWRTGTRAPLGPLDCCHQLPANPNLVPLLGKDWAKPNAKFQQGIYHRRPIARPVN